MFDTISTDRLDKAAGRLLAAAQPCDNGPATGYPYGRCGAKYAEVRAELDRRHFARLAALAQVQP